MKSYIPLLVIFILSVSTAIAISPPSLPFPFGQEIIIDGELGSNLRIKIENKNFDVIKTMTNEKGEFLVDLAIFGEGYSIGDTIKVTVERREEFRTYNVTLREEGGTFFSKSIKWDETKFTESEKEPDFKTVILFMEEDRQKNYEQSIKERNFSISIAAVSFLVSFLFFIGSWRITKCYAEKYGCKSFSKTIKKN